MGELDPYEKDFMQPCKTNNPLTRYLEGYSKISDKNWATNMSWCVQMQINKQASLQQTSSTQQGKVPAQDAFMITHKVSKLGQDNMNQKHMGTRTKYGFREKGCGKEPS